MLNFPKQKQISIIKRPKYVCSICGRERESGTGHTLCKKCLKISAKT